MLITIVCLYVFVLILNEVWLSCYRQDMSKGHQYIGWNNLESAEKLESYRQDMPKWRQYIGWNNLEFAEKLENCEPYVTPVYSYWYGVIELRKARTKIVGKKDNMCVINVFDKGGHDHDYEVAIPLLYTKDLSDILQQAFKEEIYHETEAVQKAIKFGSSLFILDSLFLDEFYQPTRYVESQQLQDYTTRIVSFFQNEYKPGYESRLPEIIKKYRSSIINENDLYHGNK